MLSGLKEHRHRKKIVAGIIVAAVAVVALSVFAITHFQSSALDAHVSLGPLEYSQQGDQLLQRNDDSVKSLRAFLKQLNATSGCNDNVYHEVIAATPDETQVLIRYGCDFANARMFAVKKDGVWQPLPPTNQFDKFNIPLCSHVESNSISRLIAPVCVEQTAGTDPRYIVR